MELFGRIVDSISRKPVEWAEVKLYVGNENPPIRYSDSDGKFEYKEAALHLDEDLTYKVEKDGYKFLESSIRIKGTKVFLGDIELVAHETGVELSFKDESNNPLENVEITLEVDGEKVGEGSTNKDGLLKFSLSPELEGKSLSYKGEIANFEVASGDIELKRKTSCEITMSRSPVIVISGKVEDNAGQSLVGVGVRLIVGDILLAELLSGNKGEFEHEEKGSQYAGQEVKYVAEKEGYLSSEGSVKIQETGARLLITLNPVPPTISTIESKPGRKPPIIPIIIGIIAIVLIIAIWPFNSPPETPSKPNGTVSGEPGTPYTYTAYATDPDGDEVIYTFDWGDGNTSESQSGQATHYWSEERSYEVRAMAKDINGASSGWSDPLVVTISQRPPETPKKPTGPGTGTVGIPYYYTTQATDPDGDDVRYTFDWGDGNTSETVLVSSGIPAQKSHIWGSAKTYKVRAKATDINGASSGWSSALVVTISQRRPTTPERSTVPTGTAGMEALKKMLHEK